MDSESILGGVTPLKARKSAGKAGKVGKVATKHNPGSGLSVSDTIDTGKGYKSNLESLTAGTRVTSSLADALGAKGPGGQPTKRGDKKDDFGKTDDFEDAGFEEKHIPGEKEKTGNRFYDACHNADGSRKAVGSTGTTTWIDENGKTQSKSFLCKWGGKSTGAHNYSMKQTDGKSMIRYHKDGKWIVDETTDKDGWKEK